MKKDELFNSVFETELRCLLLLSAKKQMLSLDRIVSLDFISCYSEEFQLPFANLHGNNDYMYSEIASRRLLIRDAIKSLVTQGMIDVSIDDGYLFSISKRGEKYIKKLESEYSNEYKTIAKEAIKMYKNKTDVELELMIQTNALRLVKGGR